SYARDHEHEVRLRERRLVGRRAKDQPDLVGDVAESCDAVSELFARLRVGDRDVRPLADEKTREPRGGAALTETDDRDAPPAELIDGDLGIECDCHSGSSRSRGPLPRPMKPSCVP